MSIVVCPVNKRGSDAKPCTECVERAGPMTSRDEVSDAGVTSYSAPFKASWMYRTRESGHDLCI